MQPKTLAIILTTLYVSTVETIFNVLTWFIAITALFLSFYLGIKTYYPFIIFLGVTWCLHANSTLSILSKYDEEDISDD